MDPELLPQGPEGQAGVGELFLQGIAASDGIAIGPAFLYAVQDLTIPTRPPGQLSVEISRFLSAREQARLELKSLRESVLLRTKGEELAAIFDAHQMMLEDPMLTEKVNTKIASGIIVEQALAEATRELAEMLSSMQDELFAARAADVQDVGRRVLRILLGLPDTALSNLQSPSLIIAQDLTPSDTARLDPVLVLGFCTSFGGLTSHSAILARTLGIPALVGMGTDLLEKVRSGDSILMDGSTGLLIVNPAEATVAKYQELKRKKEDHLLEIKASAHGEARTANGRHVEVAANIGEVETALEAVEYGAEGVGLLRTEFLYLSETRAPDEDKQYGIYKEIFTVLGQRPLIIRTMDIGGDKPPSYMPFPQEMNPFLGWRAIRMCMDDTGLFKTQLRAILRAALGHDIRIMFPMIISLDELLCARGLIAQVEAELAAEGKTFAQHVPVGIMVETPAAAVLVDVLASASDFFSIGTNDLTQYTLAVDRGNERVANLFQPLHPAVLRLIKLTIDSAHSKGKWVGMCGELAGMQKAIPILLGFGLDEFSMASRSIPMAKHLIAKLSDDRAREIAEHAISLATSAEIEGYMKIVLAELDN
jgi:phosphotransferase system enzyme I (PtsI)